MKQNPRTLFPDASNSSRAKRPSHLEGIEIFAVFLAVFAHVFRGALWMVIIHVPAKRADTQKRLAALATEKRCLSYERFQKL